jgi:hypothetical protein
MWKKFLTKPGHELQPLGRPARSHSLYRLLELNPVLSEIRVDHQCESVVTDKLFIRHPVFVDIESYGLEDQGSIPGKAKRFFPYFTAFRPALGPTQLPIQRVPRG